MQLVHLTFLTITFFDSRNSRFIFYNRLGSLLNFLSNIPFMDINSKRYSFLTAFSFLSLLLIDLQILNSFMVFLLFT